MYVQELFTCKMNPGEPLYDLTHRIRQLIKHAYPIKDFDTETTDTIFVDGFRLSIPDTLREKNRRLCIHRPGRSNNLRREEICKNR